MNENNKRFYIFTGKGGVGKTTLSLCFTQYLQEKNLNARYVYFKNSKLDEKSKSVKENIELATELGIKTIGLDLYESSKNYMGKKLNSKTIASWIIKTPFFKSLINMIPGFNYLIYMGQILELLKEDPSLIIILDSPSSGHAQTMLESTSNFNQIFQSGVIFEDTNKMIEMLNQKDFLKINIISIPTLLSLHEASELTQTLNSQYKYQTSTICNNCLTKYGQFELPDFLKTKVANEIVALDENKSLVDYKISYSMAQDSSSLIKELRTSMVNLL